MFKKTRVYLDYAAATPLSKVALEAMSPYLMKDWANPSAIHQEGLIARQAVEKARVSVARTLETKPEFVTFVSGGTESNNLAIIGLIRSLKKEGRELSKMEVVTTRLEHPSILETCDALEEMGVVVKYVGVDDKGRINLNELENLLSGQTVLFSCAYANSEIGVIQSVRTIKRVLKEAEAKFSTRIFFHLDGAQAPLWLPCQFDSLQADLLSLDAGKFNGPKGIGVLIRSRRVSLQPIIYGGGQENNLRPGTENVAAIVGASAALTEAQENYKKRAEAISKVRDSGIEYLLRQIPVAVINGPLKEQRLANNINFSIPGLDTEFATVVLDKNGFAVSTKSACAGAGGGESKVVYEISSDTTRARSTLRLSLSPHTSFSDIKKLTNVLSAHINKMATLTKQ